jgi:hypothetical protein
MDTGFRLLNLMMKGLILLDMDLGRVKSIYTKIPLGKAEILPNM